MIEARDVSHGGCERSGRNSCLCRPGEREREHGESFIKKLRAKCHKLAAIEGTIGRPRLELRADLRSFPFEGYLIFFRYAGRRFEVVNIIEHHRDIESHFVRDDDPEN